MVHLMVTLRSRVMEWRVPDPKSGIPGKAGVELQEGSSLLNVSIPCGGDESLTGS